MPRFIRGTGRPSRFLPKAPQRHGKWQSAYDSKADLIAGAKASIGLRKQIHFCLAKYSLLPFEPADKDKLAKRHKDLCDLGQKLDQLETDLIAKLLKGGVQPTELDRSAGGGGPDPSPITKFANKHWATTASAVAIATGLGVVGCNFFGPKGWIGGISEGSTMGFFANSVSSRLSSFVGFGLIAGGAVPLVMSDANQRKALSKDFKKCLDDSVSNYRGVAPFGAAIALTTAMGLNDHPAICLSSLAGGGLLSTAALTYSHWDDLSNFAWETTNKTKDFALGAFKAWIRSGIITGAVAAAGAAYQGCSTDTIIGIYAAHALLAVGMMCTSSF